MESFRDQKTWHPPKLSFCAHFEQEVCFPQTQEKDQAYKAHALKE